MLTNGKASVLLCMFFILIITVIYFYSPIRFNLNTIEYKAEAIESIPSQNTSINFSYAKPEHIKIPVIGVDADVEAVGFTRKQTMASPRNYKVVGWYKYGVMPGQKGSAVLAGHLDNGFGLPAVFKKLSKLQVGDSIYIENEVRDNLHFMVTELTTYNYKEAPLELIFNQADKEYLKLITCNGSWVGEDETYDTRLVVTAVLQK